MKHPASLGILIVSMLAALAARAQSPGLKAYEDFFKPHPPQKIAAPADLKTISLSNVGSPSSVIWETDGRWRTVRDVTQPALIPVIPQPGSANGSALIIAPGGGFLSLFMDTEGLEVAQFLAARGIACFVLMYRLDDTPADVDGYWNVIAARFSNLDAKRTFSTLSSPAVAMAESDGLAAIAWVRSRANSLGVDAQRIGFLGFSAGGITAMNVATAHDTASRPNFVGVIYGAMPKRSVPPDAPPANPLSCISTTRADTGSAPRNKAIVPIIGSRITSIGWRPRALPRRNSAAPRPGDGRVSASA